MFFCEIRIVIYKKQAFEQVKFTQTIKQQAILRLPTSFLYSLFYYIAILSSKFYYLCFSKSLFLFLTFCPFSDLLIKYLQREYLKHNKFINLTFTMKRIFLLSIALFVATFATAQQVAFQRPPEAIEQLAMADPTPTVLFNTDNSALMVLHRNRAIPISSIPLNELFLASVRINPANYSRTRETGNYAITLKQIPNGNEVKVSNLPEGGTILRAEWYPTGDKILIFYRESNGVYLYAATLADGKAVRVSDRRINTTALTTAAWVSKTDFITTCVVEGGEAPVRGYPIGPIVQENLGKQIRKRTNQGLLRDNFDVQAFEYYFTSQLVRFSPSGETTIGEPAIFRSLESSPDGSALMINRVVKPYSHTSSFKSLVSKTTIEDLQGNVLKKVKSRNKLAWRPDKPATITWVVESKKNPDHKATVYEQAAPFSEERRVVVRTTKSFDKIYWHNDEFAVVVEKGKGRRIFSSFKPCSDIIDTIASYCTSNIYEQIGEPLMVSNKYGREVIWTDAAYNELLFTCNGHSPEGMMPRLTSYNLRKGTRKDLWQCKVPYYEKVVAVKDPAAGLFISTRESLEDPKNYYLLNLKKKSETALTNLPDQFAALKGVQRKMITYTRADGVELASLVWLPAGYDAKRDGKLPILLYAYPRFRASAKVAARPNFSQYTHPAIDRTAGTSMIYFLTQGYCVMEMMAMYLIPSEKKKRANDTFVQQLVMNAEAAIKALDDAGYGDPDRVAVGGHSYGAFMTANLLTHTKLFKAGIAMSGAYNRSLTPYGFQDEKRNFWNANRVYNAMSPFNYAPKLHGALLLHHGAGDENQGTFTIQSDRYYQALRGQKKYVRYVELPFDGHKYIIRENILHMLYETNRWLEKYVKNASPTTEEKN